MALLWPQCGASSSKMVLTLLGLLWFQYKLDCIFISVKDVIDILIETELTIFVGGMDF